MISATEMLLIRACRSSEPQVRIRSVYKHRYNRDIPEFEMNHYIAHILADLCVKYNLVNIYDLMSGLSPSMDWQYPSKTEYPMNDYNIRLILLLTSKIRHCNIDKFEGYIAPGRFKRM